MSYMYQKPLGSSTMTGALSSGEFCEDADRNAGVTSASDRKMTSETATVITLAISEL